MPLPGEFWLTLARAFEPPMARATAQAFLEFLPEDLEDICAGTGFGASSLLIPLKAAMAGIPDPDSLLAHYSGLFLSPPVKARLNLGTYLDRTPNGDSQDVIEGILARYGARCRDDFHDLPDHLALLFELMALLDGEVNAGPDRQAIVRLILLPALPRLETDIGAHEPHSPYLALVRLAYQAFLEETAPAVEAPSGDRRPAWNDMTRGVWRNCRQCGHPYAREKELRIIARAMAESGLSTDHLGYCPDCRQSQPGWTGKSQVQ